MKSLYLLILLPLAASAQITYDYTSGPITSSQAFGSFSAVPLGTDVTGVITLAQQLPENGTTTVTPLSVEFEAGAGGPGLNSPQATGGTFEFTFKTTNGAVTGFNFVADSVMAGNNSYSGDSGQDTMIFTLANAAGGVSAQAQAGHWVDPPAPAAHLGHGVPEIDASGWAGALTLLLGVLVIQLAATRTTE